MSSKSKISKNYLMDLRKQVGSQLLLCSGTRCVLLNSDDQILLEKRSDFNVWGLPGGGSEIGEDIKQAAIRELQEEIGVNVTNLAPFAHASNPKFETIIYPNGDQCQYVSMLFWANIGNAYVKVNSSESTDIGWFSQDKIPTNILPNMLNSIEAFKQFQKTGMFQLI